MGSFGDNISGVIWGWDHTIGDGLGDDGPTPKMELGVSVHLAGRVFVEGVLSSG